MYVISRRNRLPRHGEAVLVKLVDYSLERQLR